MTSFFHATILSNFGRAFDKYAFAYDKSRIPESTYPGQFFVVTQDELSQALAKATRLLHKTALVGDQVLLMEAAVQPEALQPNLRTNVGQFLASNELPLKGLWVVDASGTRTPISVEDASAAALRVLHPVMAPYEDLVPRTLSFLPIARACQAKCLFCFSESSASLEQRPQPVDFDRLGSLVRTARAAGAERFVITGGGEPGLLAHETLLQVIRVARSQFDKVVLITNGRHLSRLADDRLYEALRDYEEAGLGVLAISRHHASSSRNATIMGLDTQTERVGAAYRLIRPDFRLRFICVLQRGGVESPESIAEYLTWAAGTGAEEVCFKELYVSTMAESAYHENPENQWAREHQVPLSVLNAAMPQLGFSKVAELPWGSPVFRGIWQGRVMTVAAYTEPSLFWERTHGVARSWNLMADGRCLASLEDPHSFVDKVRGPKTIPLKAIA